MLWFGFLDAASKSRSNGSRSMITFRFKQWPWNKQQSLKGRRRRRTGARRQHEIEMEFTLSITIKAQQAAAAEQDASQWTEGVININYLHPLHHKHDKSYPNFIQWIRHSLTTSMRLKRHTHINMNTSSAQRVWEYKPSWGWRLVVENGHLTKKEIQARRTTSWKCSGAFMEMVCFIITF